MIQISTTPTTTAAELACLERLMSTDGLKDWEPSDPALGSQIEEPSQRQPAADQGSILSDYLTKQQLAAELGRSVRTIDRWLLQGDGPPPTTLGMEQLFRRDAVREWLLAKEQKRPRRRI